MTKIGKAILQLEKKRTAEAGFHAFYIRKINNSLLRNLHESMSKQADHFIKPFPGIIFSRFNMDNYATSRETAVVDRNNLMQ